MNKALKYAIGIQLLIMLSVFVPPMVTVYTGDTIFLETQRVDPRALFRGDYVILDYQVGLEVSKDTALKAYEEGKPIYITVTTDRPGSFVAASLDKPELKQGEACVIARAMENVRWMAEEPRAPRIPGETGAQEFRQSFVQFPQIAQYFVSEGTGKDIEADINDMVAELKVTKGCKAVVRGLELL